MHDAWADADTEVAKRSRTQTRRRLIEAAPRVFVERGIGGASVAQICSAAGFTRGRNVCTATLPFTKEEISAHVGVNGCSMAAITDIGFANAFAAALSQEYPGKYDELASAVGQRFSKAERRKKEAAAHERNKRNGKRRTNV